MSDERPIAATTVTHETIAADTITVGTITAEKFTSSVIVMTSPTTFEIREDEREAP